MEEDARGEGEKNGKSDSTKKKEDIHFKNKIKKNKKERSWLSGKEIRGWLTAEDGIVDHMTDVRERMIEIGRKNVLAGPQKMIKSRSKNSESCVFLIFEAPAQ